jgi:hypothetical protein
MNRPSERIPGVSRTFCALVSMFVDGKSMANGKRNGFCYQLIGATRQKT